MDREKGGAREERKAGTETQDPAHRRGDERIVLSQKVKEEACSGVQGHSAQLQENTDRQEEGCLEKGRPYFAKSPQVTFKDQMQVIRKSESLSL